jgi:hypothetical protein
MQYEFLTDEWISAVDVVRRNSPQIEEPPEVSDLSVNFLIDDFPGGPRTVHLAGTTNLAAGPLHDAETTITLTYRAARTLFIDGDFPGALEAFMVGDIDIEGEMSTLIALQDTLSSLTPNQHAFHSAIIQLTAST